MPVTSKSGGIQQRLLNHHGTFDTLDLQSSVSSVISANNDMNDKLFNGTFDTFDLQSSVCPVISANNDMNDKLFNQLISGKTN